MRSVRNSLPRDRSYWRKGDVVVKKMKRCISCGKIIWWWQFEAPDGKEHSKCWNVRIEKENERTQKINKLLKQKNKLLDNINTLKEKYEIGGGNWLVLLERLIKIHPEVWEDENVKDFEARRVKYEEEAKEFQIKFEEIDKELSELGKF